MLHVRYSYHSIIMVVQYAFYVLCDIIVDVILAPCLSWIVHYNILLPGRSCDRSCGRSSCKVQATFFQPQTNE